jgi:benzoyl-CoA reductase subunit D
MIAIGIDCGSQNTKAALLQDGALLGVAKIPTAFDLELAAKGVLDTLLRSIDCKKADTIIATGVGRDSVTFATETINEVTAAARGAFFTDPKTRLIIDLGAESCRVISLKANGRVKHYESNDKCASGVGTFVETMARTLQIGISEIGEYSLKHTKDISMVAQCVVFAESEVVSLIHQNESIENIAHGIHYGIASKVISLVRREGIADYIVLIGGAGHNKGLIKCLEDGLGQKLIVPENVDFITAVGAAAYGGERKD